MVASIYKDMASAYETEDVTKMRTCLEKLEGTQNLLDYHDSHIMDLGYFLLELREKPDSKWVRDMKGYLLIRLQKLERQREIYLAKLGYENRKHLLSELARLDLTYKTWTYTHGYECGTITMLKTMLRKLENYEQENKTIYRSFSPFDMLSMAVCAKSTDTNHSASYADSL